MKQGTGSTRQETRANGKIGKNYTVKTNNM